MNKPHVMIFLAAATQWMTACNLIDDEPGPRPGEDTGGSADDDQKCLDAAQALDELHCASGYTPQLHYDGGGSTIIEIDDPALAVGLSVGLLVGFGAGTKADWVGYKVTQNTVCTFGCFIGCQSGQDGCVGDPELNGCLWCADSIEQQECSDFVASCEPAEPDDDGGLDETGGGEGLDETGGEETSGGVMGEADGCGQWHPEAVRRSVPGGAFHVPQALVDQLVLGNAEVLAECDGVRLRQGSDGRWVISKMRRRGLLGALGLQVGDEIRALDGKELDSIDASVGVLMASFLAEDGNPRQFSTGHPGFSLEVRRGERRFEVGLKVVPTGVSNEGPADERGR